MLHFPGTLLGPMSPDLLISFHASAVRIHPLGLISTRYATPRSMETKRVVRGWKGQGWRLGKHDEGDDDGVLHTGV